MTKVETGFCTFSLSDLKDFPIVDSQVICPQGDYRGIEHFPGNLRFSSNSIFGSYSTFKKNTRFGRCSIFGMGSHFSSGTIFGEWSSFGEVCYFEEFCYFGPWCVFNRETIFGKSCTFLKACMFGEYTRFTGICQYDKIPFRFCVSLQGVYKRTILLLVGDDISVSCDGRTYERADDFIMDMHNSGEIARYSHVPSILAILEKSYRE